MPEKEQVFRIRGVVLRCADTGDTDRMLTILTQEEGKLSVFAKGVRKLTAASLSACQPFAYADFLLRRGRDYCYLRESATIETFHGICQSLSAQALAVYLCEAAEEMTYPGGESGDLLRLVLNTLWTLAGEKKPEYLVKGAFELRAAAISGYMPELRVCCACGNADVGGSAVLDVMNGRIFCARCFDALYDTKMPQSNPYDDRPPTDETGTAFVPRRVLPEALDAMRYILSAPAKRQFSFTVPHAAAGGFSRACEDYLLSHIGHGYASLGYYKSTAEMLRSMEEMAAGLGKNTGSASFPASEEDKG